MIGFLVALLSPFRKALAWIAGTALLIGGAFLAGRRDAKKDEAVKDLKADIKAHERINNADLGLGATDEDRVKRLRQMSERLKS